MPCYFLHVLLYEELKKYEKIVLQLEWARDCKANDYVYLGQVTHIDETKDININFMLSVMKVLCKIPGHDLWTTLAVWSDPSSQFQNTHE